ncbi:hypothetical protein HYH03_004147 [Edaphochlamys debaryana]|uniref:EGF-like domain-containing protein n=1 Tax=Edaphochlamys debaryana TaxID=47281 RepID=A0A835Y8A8_9CHLO|nr:hypothetical protein HYH03_004147 [Edaphochlamys debaryana]|eukprot:KAG2497881.1 hypothetical protein HYH03_004147 [Edaphochlamys debaryana]
MGAQNDSKAAAVLGEKTTDDPQRAAKRRCAGTRGAWCGRMAQQAPVPTRPPPRGSKGCPNDCSGWGNCDHDTGLCVCPAQRAGPDCGEEVKRPCTLRYRHPWESHVKTAVGHVGPDHHDLNVSAPGWLASRCNGYCLDDFAMCMCGYNSTYRHIPAPPGSPPWTPPVQWGRPTPEHCHLGEDRDGNKIEWGRPHIKWADLYGDMGWCNNENPIHHCGCLFDGNDWPCDGSRRFEAYCANQCTGHGDCHWGFCKCHPGWYGSDCSRKKAGEEPEEGYLSRPWLQRVVVVPPASLPSPPKPTRPRPLIYVYDMAPYTSRFLQYRLGADSCMWRRFDSANNSILLPMTYSIEVHLHEMMLQSEHRTFDPEEADFFYVPIYFTCFMWPVLGWADHPWFYAPNAHSRPMHVINMVLEAQAWLEATYPWWRRRGGRDHIWLTAMDEGACYMPTNVYNASIMLTHWGRTDPEHTSGSAYLQDDYSIGPNFFKNAANFSGWPGQDWRDKIKGHPCYDPKKDVVIPAFKPPEHFISSPLMGAPPMVRDILLYFRGDIGAARLDRYSRGIRQRLFKLAHDNDWVTKHSIYIGNGETVVGPYSEHMARSKFCLMAPGDGWSPRAEDAVLHGCVPLVIMDGVDPVWGSLLDWSAFSVRVQEQALQAVPQILEAIPPARLAAMQRALTKVWHRFAWGTGPVMADKLAHVFRHNAQNHPANVNAVGTSLTYRATPFVPRTSFPREDDAFSTLMQWLYHRIDDTR